MHFTLSAILTAASAIKVFASPIASSSEGNVEASTAELSKRWTGPSCGVHIVQYQKHEDGVGDNYQLTITLKDALGTTVGGLVKVDAIERRAVEVDSQLPYVFLATVGAIDTDTIAFDYAGQHWSSASGQCKFGDYYRGSRQGDCGFSCK